METNSNLTRGHILFILVGKMTATKEYNFETSEFFLNAVKGIKKQLKPSQFDLIGLICTISGGIIFIISLVCLMLLANDISTQDSIRKMSYIFFNQLFFGIELAPIGLSLLIFGYGLHVFLGQKVLS